MPTLAVLLPLLCLLLLQAYSVNAELRVPGDQLVETVSGVHLEEKLAKRIGAHSMAHVRLPNAAYSGHPTLVRIDLMTPGNVPKREARLWLDDSASQTITVQSGWRRYTLVLPANPEHEGMLDLNLATSVSEFPNDLRQLGVSIAGISVTSLERQLLVLQLAARLILLVALLTLILRLVGLALSLALPLAGAILLVARPLLGSTPAHWSLLIGGLAGLGLLSLLLHANGWQRNPRVRSGLLVALGVLIPLCYLHPGSALISQLLLISAAGVGLLLYAGFGITWFLRSRATAALLPLLTPFIGLTAISIFGHALAYVPVGTQQMAWPLLGILTVINWLAWRRGARPILSRSHAPALIGALAAWLVALLPFVYIGYLTTIGYPTDAISYFARAEYLQHHAIMDIPQRRIDAPLSDAMASHMNIGIREGDAYFLALLGSLLDLRPHLLFSVVMAIWFALLPVGAYVLARYELRLQQRAVLIGTLLVAVQPLLLWPVMGTFFSQAAALPLWPVVLVAVSRAVRYGTRRAIVCAALLAAALASIYHTYLAYTALIAFGLALLAWWDAGRAGLRRLPAGTALRRRLAAALLPAGRLTLRGGAIAALALILVPVAWILIAWQTQFLRSQVINGRIHESALGDTRLFPPLGELIGVVNHLSWHAGRPISLPAYPESLTTALTVAALVLLLYAIVRGTRRQRQVATTILLVFAAALWQQRYVMDQGRGYAYGYFKVATMACIPLIVVLAQGLRRLGRDAKYLPAVLSQTMLLGTQTLLAILFGSAIYFCAQTASYVSYNRIIADSAMLEIEQVAEIVPEEEPLLLVDTRNLVSWYWDLYLLNLPSVYFHQPAPFWRSAVQAQSPRLIRYALIAQPSEEDKELLHDPWFNAETSQVLWQNSRYRLVRRSDNVVAELPAPLDDLLPPLTRTLEIEVNDGWLRVWDTDHRRPLLQQQLAGSPELLQLLFKSEPQARVSITQGEQQRQLTLREEWQDLRLPIDGSLRLRLQQLPGPAAQLFEVRVRGAPEERLSLRSESNFAASAEYARTAAAAPATAATWSRGEPRRPAAEHATSDVPANGSTEWRADDERR